MKGKILLKYVLLAMLIAAVTVSAAASGQSSGPTAPAGKKSFSILLEQFGAAPMPPDIDPNNNKWVNILKKELPDIDINWIITPAGQLQQRLNVMIGAGEPPDTFPMTMSQMIQWADQGIIQPLDSLLKNSYKNINNFLVEEDLKPTKYNNHSYGIMVPNNRLENPQTMVIRTDWLENLGLQPPKTIDQFYNVLHAFTFKDPDRNGKNDTYGIAGVTNFNYLWQVFGMFGVQHSDSWFSKIGNQIIPDIIRPEMKEAVAFLAKLYKEGILDKDTLNMGGPQLEEKAVRGLIGVWSFASWGISIRHIPNLKKNYPNAKVDLLIPPPAADGNIYTHLRRNGLRMFGVSSKCKYPETVVYYFNWIIEQDKSTLPIYRLNFDKMYLGELGRDSYIIGGKFQDVLPTNLLSPEAALDMYRYAYRTHWGTIQSLPDDLLWEFSEIRVKEGIILPYFLEAQRFAAKYGRPNAAAVTGPVYAQYMTDINTYWEETIAAIVTGSKPISAFDDFVKFFYANGGQKVIDEVTAMNK